MEMRLCVNINTHLRRQYCVATFTTRRTVKAFVLNELTEVYHCEKVRLRAVSLLLENPQGKSSRARVTRYSRLRRSRVTRAGYFFPTDYRAKERLLYEKVYVLLKGTKKCYSMEEGGGSVQENKHSA